MKTKLFFIFLLILNIGFSQTDIEYVFSADVQNVSQEGDVINYSFHIIPFGSDTYSQINFSNTYGLENLQYVSGDSNNNSIIETNEDWLFTATHIVTQAELANNGTPSNSGLISYELTFTLEKPNGEAFLYFVVENVAINASTYLADDVFCADEVNNSVSLDLGYKDSLVLNGNNPNDFTITYHENYNDAFNGVNILPNPYVAYDAPRVYARRESNIDATFEVFSFVIYINEFVSAYSPTPLVNCQSNFTFDLASKNNEIIGGQTNIQVSYYLTQSDAENGLNLLPYFYNTSITQQLFVRAYNYVSGCYNTTTLLLEFVNCTDTDGDGVTDSQEIIDGTDPNDLCSFILANQTVGASQTWFNTDCDNDGLTNHEETTGIDDPSTPANPHYFTDPLNPDTDGDGSNDAEDNRPLDPCTGGGGGTPDLTNPIYADADCDGDGVSNKVEITPPNGGFSTDPYDPCDFDPLNIVYAQSIEFLQEDCDNDGISNEIELGADPMNPVDTDGDNYIDMLDLDSDDDGIVDEIEFGNASGGDTDGDNLPDYLDQDSDNDGIPDNVEGQTTLDYIPPTGLDSDSDGIDEAYDNPSNSNWIFPIDTDNDGTPDYIDEDSDDDSVDDNLESGIQLLGEDIDNDGLDDGAESNPSGYGHPQGILNNGALDLPNTNGTGDVDFRDSDDDNDGVPTSVEAVLIFRSSPAAFLDTDGDQIPNYLDNDDDGDGVLTINEDYNNDGDPTNDDTNNNGVPDYLDEDVALGVLTNYLLEFQFYPNPVNNLLTIKLEELSNNTTFTIYNLQGKVVYKKQEVLNQQTEINIANFSSGVYFIKLESDNNTAVRKFVKK